MIKTITLSLLPAEAADEQTLKKNIAAECGCSLNSITGYIIQKRSIDARAKQVKIILLTQVFIEERVVKTPTFDPELTDVSNAPHVAIVGAGPA